MFASNLLAARSQMAFTLGFHILLVPLGLVIESALGSMFSYTARQKGDVGRTLPGHERILLAIRARRPNAARAAVRKLLGDTSRMVGEVIQAAGRRVPSSGSLSFGRPSKWTPIAQAFCTNSN